MNKIETKDSNILHTDFQINSTKVSLILTYFSCTNQQRNIKMKKEITEKVKDSSDKHTIVLGDFNSHVGFQGPQPLNKNGELVLDMMEETNLTLLNGLPECTGEITRSQNNTKSAIDLVLVNDRLLSLFSQMVIDENKDIYDLSDHNLVQIDFKVDDKPQKYQDQKPTRRTVLSKKEEHCKKYTTYIEDKLSQHPNDITNITSLETIMQEGAQKFLVKTYTSRTHAHEEKTEPIWITEHIRKEIRQRKEYNRQARRATTQVEKERLTQLYLKQKKHVKEEIRMAIHKHEKIITENIKKNKNSNMKLWKQINYLRGKENTTQEITLYENANLPIPKQYVQTKLNEYWKTIYQKHTCDIEEVWKPEEREVYITDFQSNNPTTMHISINGQTVNLPAHLLEHYDAIQVETPPSITNMKQATITELDITQALTNLKNNKATGPDNIKGELFKLLANSHIFKSTLQACLNNTLTNNQVPQSWKTSKTIMLQKKKKPTVSDLRPIALLNTSYKLFMSILRSKIDEHIHHNKQANELQAGFTRKRRLEDNLFILTYCIEKSFKMKKPLIVTAIDFRKAFDSVKRNKLIECMKRFRIHPHIIDIVSEIYQNDTTIMYLNNEIQTQMNVTSGIRQGCNGSTSLFLLLTYLIILHLNQAQSGYRDEVCFLPALFYADDGLLLAQSVHEAQDMITTLTDSASACGLEINKDKSYIMIYNSNTEQDNISGVKITNEIRYLGINITNKRRCFKNFKATKINEARRLSNTTAAVVARSSNRLLIGKTFWKQVAMPKFLHCQGIIPYTKSELDALQRAENKTYRILLRAPNYTPNSFLKGEVGSTSMKNRDIKAKLLYVKHIMDHPNNNLLRHCFLHKLETCKDKWTKTILKYLHDYNINIYGLSNTTQQKIVTSIKERDTQEWKNELFTKDSLTLYRQYKPDIEESDFYENDEASTLLMRCRSNTLKLNTRNRHTNGNTQCTQCNTNQDETLEHFLLHCDAYRHYRQQLPFLETDTITDEEKLANLLLFTDKQSVAKKKEIILHMWRQRAQQL